MPTAPESPNRIGLLIVPGLGTGRSGQALLVFAEALLTWLQRWSATHHTTNLLEPSRLHVHVRHSLLDPTNGGRPQTVVVLDKGSEGTLEIIVSEGLWPSRIRPPAASVLGRWLIRVLPFLLLDIVDTVVLRDARRFARKPLSWWRIMVGLIGLLLAVPLAIVLLVAVLSILLLSWLHLPGIDRVGAWLELRLAQIFGDSHVLTTSPVQANAAVEAIRQQVDDLAEQCDAVAILAFAQGAAVAHEALRRWSQPKLRLLATVGSGLRKYHELPGAGSSKARPWQAFFGVLFSVWFLAGPVWALWVALSNPSIGRLLFVVFYFIVHGSLAAAFFSSQYGRSVAVASMTYALRGAGTEFDWIDYYASADIVANGPVVDQTSEAPTPGWPREVEVHNRGSWFSDHASYLANDEEFLGDLVPRLIGLGSEDSPPDASQHVAEARRYWRVKWLIAARALVAATAIALLLRLYLQLAAIGSAAIELVPGPLRELIALAAKPFADLPIPRLSEPVVGVFSIALAGWAMYGVLLLTWRSWDRRDRHIFFSGREYDAGGWPFGLFLAGVAAVALGAIGVVTSPWFDADPIRTVFEAIAALPLPSGHLLTLGVMALSAAALYRVTIVQSSTSFFIRLFSGGIGLWVLLSIVWPKWAWTDDTTAPGRREQLLPVLIGGLAGLAVGEAARQVRRVAVARVLPWITRRSLIGAPSSTWGRHAPRGAELLRTVSTGGLAVRFSGNGRQLVTVSSSTVVVYDTRSGRVVSRFSAWPRLPTARLVAISDNLVAIATGEEVVLWTIETGSRVDRWYHEDAVVSLASSANGRLLASAGEGGVVRIWDVHRRAEIWQHDAGARLRQAVFGAGNRLAIVVDSGVQLWRPIESLWTKEPGQPIDVDPDQAAFDPTGKQLAVATYRQVTLWDVTSGHEIAHRKVSNPISAMAFHPSGKALVIAAGNDVHVWHPDDPSGSTQLYHEWGEVQDLDFQRDGSHLVTTCDDGITAIWAWLDAPS